MHNPKEPHLQAAHQHYSISKEHQEKYILFKKNRVLVLKAYMNVNYARSMVNRRSTIEYCTFLVGNCWIVVIVR